MEIVGDIRQSDSYVAEVKKRLEQDSRDNAASVAIEHLVDLVLAVRRGIPAGPLPAAQGAALTAATLLIKKVNGEALENSLPSLHSNPWAQYDGPAFCDLARQFYAIYLSVLLESVSETMVLELNRNDLNRFAYEASVITRSFSARWFNACARLKDPDLGSVRWYWRHCLGKLELELDREASDWIEPTGNPWRRKRPKPPQLDFGT